MMWRARHASCAQGRMLGRNGSGAQKQPDMHMQEGPCSRLGLDKPAPPGTQQAAHGSACSHNRHASKLQWSRCRLSPAAPRIVI